MRDPGRIDKFCDELKEYWHKVPDWRFGQLIVNVFEEIKKDPFFIEDDKMLDLFKNFFTTKRPEPIAYYPVTNTGVVFAYEIDNTNDQILAAFNEQEPEWYKIITEENGSQYFEIGALKIPFPELQRI